MTSLTSEGSVSPRTPDRSSTETTLVRNETETVARMERRVAAFAGVPETLCSPINVLRDGQVAMDYIAVVGGLALCI